MSACRRSVAKLDSFFLTLIARAKSSRNTARRQVLLLLARRHLITINPVPPPVPPVPFPGVPIPSLSLVGLAGTAWLRRRRSLLPSALGVENDGNLVKPQVLDQHVEKQVGH